MDRRRASVGDLRRRLTLGEDVAADAITATFADGVLSVTMPVAERAKPRRVVVERAGQPRQVTASAGSAGSSPQGIAS